MSEAAPGGQVVSWLVLIHHLPADSGSLRMKVWRRLQAVGAVSLKGSMYVLPLNDQTQEDFQWILREIEAAGAEGAILESRFVSGMSDPQVRELFNTARNADYASLGKEIKAHGESLPRGTAGGEARGRENRTAVARFRKRLAEIEAIDFFGAGGREGAAAILEALEARIEEQMSGARTIEKRSGARGPIEMQGRVWVTRSNVRVDRIASAWLVRRFIDTEARFKFFAGKRYEPGPGEVRFDMYEAEFTHEGDRCTYEVLLVRSGIEDKALARIGEIVHDIDLKDGKYGREETQGISSLLDGIVAGEDDDEERLRRGGALFDDLYRAFGKRGR